MKDKRGQGISINTIIIAAIALIVLVVLIAIFTGRIGLFGQGVEKVVEGRVCAQTCFPTDLTGSTIGKKVMAEGKVRTGQCPTQEHQVYGTFTDTQEGEICCVMDELPSSDPGCPAAK